MKYSISIQYDHYEALKNHLLRTDGKERMAFMICGRSLTPQEDRFLGRELVFLEDDDLIDFSATHVKWSNTHSLKVIKRAEKKNFGVVLFHSHPAGFDRFSETDDKGESELFQLAFNRNGGDRPNGSIVMLPNGDLFGRVWKPNLTHEPLSIIRVLGEKTRLFYPERLKGFETPSAFNRQQLAFGDSLIQDLSKLSCAIVWSRSHRICNSIASYKIRSWETHSYR